MMNIPLTQRAQQVKPFLAMEVMERAKEMEAQGREIIYLCLGEPDFATPPAPSARSSLALAGTTTKSPRRRKNVASPSFIRATERKQSHDLECGDLSPLSIFGVR